ncbi:hypothetical protein SANTM175S_11017 [Streptomyces antimycoticus]
MPADMAEKASLWRSRTADARIAVVLDNAFTAAQVRPLLHAGPGGLTVVTSRRRLTGLRMDGAAMHQLEALEPAAGAELLSRAIGDDRVANEPQAARQVVALCAGLPLAVCLAFGGGVVELLGERMSRGQRRRGDGERGGRRAGLISGSGDPVDRIGTPVSVP